MKKKNSGKKGKNVSTAAKTPENLEEAEVQEKQDRIVEDQENQENQENKEVASAPEASAPAASTPPASAPEVQPAQAPAVEGSEKSEAEVEKKKAELAAKEKIIQEKLDEKNKLRAERLLKIEQDRELKKIERETARKEKLEKSAAEKLEKEKEMVELMKIERTATCTFNPVTSGWEIKVQPDGERFFKQGFAHSNLELNWIKRTFRDSKKMRSFGITKMEIQDGDVSYTYDIDDPKADYPGKKSGKSTAADSIPERDGRKIVVEGLGSLKDANMEGVLLNLVGNVHKVEFLTKENQIYNLEFKAGVHGMTAEKPSQGWKIIQVGEELTKAEAEKSA